jgi:hypothetical protein
MRETKEFTVVAFSKRFLVATKSREKSEDYSYVFVDEAFPDKSGYWDEVLLVKDYLAAKYVFGSKEGHLKYGAYLQRCGLDAQAIIERGKKGQKTVFVDYAESGESLASFLFVLFETCADKQMVKEVKKHMQLAVYLRHHLQPPPLKSLCLPGFGKVMVDTLVVNEQQQQLVNVLTNTPNNGESAQHTARLVPYYPADKWPAWPDEQALDLALNGMVFQNLLTKC